MSKQVDDLEAAFNPKGGAAEAERLSAVGALDANRGVELCRQALAAGSAKVKARALRLLSTLSPEEARAAAVQVWGSRTAKDVRRAAVDVLAQLGPNAVGAIVALIAALGDSDFHVKSAARVALERFGPVTVPHLVPLLHEAGSERRRYATWLVGNIGPPGVAAVPGLCHLLLHDPDPYIPRDAAVALSKIGPAAAAAVPELRARLERATGRLRSGIALALFKIAGDETAVPLVAEVLQDPDWEVRRQALFNLEEFGPVAIPALIAALRTSQDLHGHANTRRLAAEALGAQGGAARAAVPALESATGDANALVRQAVLTALAKWSIR